MKALKTYNKYYSSFLIMVLLFAIKSHAQVDPHFSQYYAYPLWLNPALTGVVDGEYRANINLKQQWGAVANPYLTGGASFDLAPKKNLAFGVTVLNQSAGDLDFNYLTALASASYRIRLGQEGLNIVSFGLQGGIINQSFDLSGAQFGNQYNGGSGYDPSMGSSEMFQSSSALMPDVNFGIMYFDGNPDRQFNPFFGVSVGHLTQPVQKFLGRNEKLPMRFTAHGGSRVRVSDNVDFMPNALFLYQGNASEISAGGYVQLMSGQQTSFLIGANYRVKDAAIAYLGLNYRNMVFGFSYDVNTSSLQRATNSNGSFEISVTLLGRKSIVGPNFYCPRL